MLKKHSDFISFLKQLQLQVKLNNLLNDNIEKTCYLTQAKNVLNWFYHQDISPYFVWQHREQNTSFVGLGESKTYDSLPENIATHSNNSQKIWGGQGFLPTTKYFFIPILQIEIHTKLNQLTNCDNVLIDIVIDFTDPQKTKDWLLALDLTILDSYINDSNTNSNIGSNAEILPEALTATFNYVPNKTNWQLQIDKILSHINAQAIDKLVIARQANFVTNADSAWNLFKQSVKHNHNCYHLFWRFDADNQIVSATPERLLRRDNNQLITEALAGTAPLNNDLQANLDNENWLQNSNKNLHENSIVVTDISQQLQPFTDNLEIDATAKVIKQRRVQHLKLGIKAKIRENLPDFPTSEILKALHPTAAILGYPRQKVLKLLTTDNTITENFPRNWYSGYFGYSEQYQIDITNSTANADVATTNSTTEQHAEYCVILRCAYFQQNQCTCYSGAGIVDGSQANTEWDELNQKLATLTDLFIWK